MRRFLTFPCAGESLAATLDEAPGLCGLLIVSLQAHRRGVR